MIRKFFNKDEGGQDNSNATEAALPPVTDDFIQNAVSDASLQQDLRLTPENQRALEAANEMLEMLNAQNGVEARISHVSFKAFDLPQDVDKALKRIKAQEYHPDVSVTLTITFQNAQTRIRDLPVCLRLTSEGCLANMTAKVDTLNDPNRACVSYYGDEKNQMNLSKEGGRRIFLRRIANKIAAVKHDRSREDRAKGYLYQTLQYHDAPKGGFGIHKPKKGRTPC